MSPGDVGYTLVPGLGLHPAWRGALTCLRVALMRSEEERIEGIQTLVAFLREHVATVQDVAAQTDPSPGPRGVGGRL